MAPNQKIIDENYAAFKKMLPGIMLQHAGRFALMHNAGIVDFFDTARDAVITRRPSVRRWQILGPGSDPSAAQLQTLLLRLTSSNHPAA